MRSTTIPSLPPQGPTSEILVDRYIDFFSAQIKHNPDSFDAYIELGNLYREKKDFNHAFTLHRNLLARTDISKDQMAIVHMEMGFDYLAAQTKDFGISFFLDALKRDKKNIRAQKGLYQSYLQQRMYDDALKALEKLNALDPVDQSMFFDLYCETTVYCLEQKNIASAKKAHAKALKIKNTPFLKLSHIQIQLVENKTQSAIDNLVLFIDTYPKHAYFFVQKLEELLFESKQYANYFQILNGCLQGNENHPFIHLALAKYYQKTSQSEHAKTHFIKAMGEHPRHALIFRESMIHLINDIQAQPTDQLQAQLNTFYQALTSKKSYTCTSCHKNFEHVPKDCRQCKGWNLFDQHLIAS